MERQSSTSSDSSIKDGQGKMDGSEYVPARCRITKPSPPKPAKNPLQFVKIGPCDLYRSAQEQIKKVEVIKKIKQDLRDDSQDWQSNLDSWKNNRRKRQEHIIERVVEIKNMEVEQDKSRRRSKTFSEMMEERSSRRRKFNVLPTYNENDGNDLSELGISTSNRNTSISDDSASEDPQNARYSSDDQYHSEKLNSSIQDHISTSHTNMKSDDSINNNNENNINENRCDDESNHLTKSEYTYESAIQGYKTRVKQQSYQEPTSNDIKVHYGKDKNDRSSLCTLHTFNMHTSELSSSSPALSSKVDLPKIDISKRKQLFEMGETNKKSSKVIENLPGELSHSSSIKDRLKDLEKYTEESMKIKKAARRLSGDIMTVRERLSGLVAQNSDESKSSHDISTWASAGELRRPIDLCDRVIEVNIEEKERVHNSDVNHYPSTSKCENDNKRLENNQFSKSLQIDGSRASNLRHSHDKKNSRIDENLTESLRVSLSKLDNTNKVNNAALTCTKDNVENVSNNLFSPIYEKGRVFHYSLDNLHMHENGNGQCNLEHVQSLDGLDYCSQNYPPSGSSTELLALSQCGDTDREDSGIQTADVSCSVSQADEPDDDTDMLTTINNTHVDQHIPVNTNGLDDGQHDLPVETYLSSIELQSYDNHKSPELTYNSHKSPESTFDKNEVEQGSENDIEEKNNKNIHSTAVPTVDKSIIPPTENIEIQTKILFEQPAMGLFNSRTDSIPDPLAPPKSMEPPKEKPPPPPTDIPSDDELSKSESQSEFKRLNSTKRIKNDLRNKRSSFLGIEGLPNDYLDQELILTKPPDANVILQEELQLEKQLYRRSQSYLTEPCPSVDLESRDSGVELEVRSDNTNDLEKLGSSDYEKSSQKLVEPFEEDEISKKEREIIENLEKEEQWRHNYSQNKNSYPHKVLSKNNSKTFNNDNFINSSGQKSHFVNKNIVRSSTTSSFTDDEHAEDVLRVERELLQLEQEQLERQREDYLMQNSKIINQSNSAVSIKPGHSLQDISANADNRTIRNNSDIYSNYLNYYQSTPDLQLGTAIAKRPIPPVKSTRLEEINYNPNQMSKHALHALSAAPRSRLMTTDSWIQPQVKKSSSAVTLTPSLHECQNYNNHWLIQEAEQRRLSEQQRPMRSNASVLNGHCSNLQPMHEQHIPDSVVQTLTQRLQNRLTIRERNNILNRNEKTMNQERLGGFSGPSLVDSMCNQPNHNPSSCSNQIPISSLQTPSHTNSSGPMLSVSGRKKCSHCGDELGRGAAMIIESLCLFYHMDCFKCCVCHVQLGDGRMGTDVRVRNHKLHCHNCYSSDDGIKFSCV